MKQLTIYSRFGYVLIFGPNEYDTSRTWVTLYNPDGVQVEQEAIEHYCQSDGIRGYTQFRGLYKNPKVITYRMLASIWTEKFGFDRKDFPNVPIQDPKRRSYKR